MLRCLGMPPPQPTAILARAVAARAALRSYQPKEKSQSRSTTGGGGAPEEFLPNRGRAVERAFWTGLAALSSQGCMRGAPVRWGDHGPCVDDARLDCVLRAVSSAVVLRGGDRAEWPVGAKQSTHVRACHTPTAMWPLSYPHNPCLAVPISTPFHPPPPPLPPPPPPHHHHHHHHTTNSSSSSTTNNNNNNSSITTTSPLSPSYGLPTSPPYQHYTTTSSTPVTATPPYAPTGQSARRWTF